jgi:hypothetical protein
LPQAAKAEKKKRARRRVLAIEEGINDGMENSQGPKSKEFCVGAIHEFPPL